jgi:hypothetical protein
VWERIVRASPQVPYTKGHLEKKLMMILALSCYIYKKELKKGRE